MARLGGISTFWGTQASAFLNAGIAEDTDALSAFRRGGGLRLRAEFPLLLTAFYMVLPVGQIRFGHALAGGVTATVLWEVARHVMVWYFAKLSMVKVIYGAMAAGIVVLLTLEAAAVILLFGGEVIAEIDRARVGRARARQCQ